MTLWDMHMDNLVDEYIEGKNAQNYGIPKVGGVFMYK